MIKRLARIGLSAVLFATAGCQEPAVIVNPEWASIPSADSMTEAFPTFATMAGLSGRVEMLCLSVVNGVLAECRVVRAAPAGTGFENAAVGLTQEFRVAPKTVDGAPKNASVRFTINFRLGEEPAVAPYTGRPPLPGALAATRQMVRSGFAQDLRTTLARDLQVDADRREAVTAMVERAMRATEAELIEAQALAMARALSPQQAIDVAQGYRPSGTLPTNDQIAAAGPELKRVDVRTSEILRTEYCAAYPCGAEFPST